MKDILKRWNQLAGTDKILKEDSKSKLASQELYGNQHIKDLLNEEFHPDLDEDVDEDLGAALADKAEEGGDEESDDKESGESSGEGEEEEEDGDIGDEEKPTLSNSELKKGLKQGAADIADAVPPMLNDEFADVMNSVKDMTTDKQKLMKLIKYIDKIK